METQKIISALHTYKQILEKRGSKPIPAEHDNYYLSEEAGLSHILYMINKILDENMIQTDIEKTFRWLGFIQGALWSVKIFTIEELKNHNS